MNTFLEIMAGDMLAHYGNDMRSVKVVFPGKRAGIFLGRAFASMSDTPVWAPAYCTIGELFHGLTDLQTADRITCICQIYSIIKEKLDDEYPETIDEFWSWGEVLLSDFEDIDKHLGNARDIFTNIADRQRIEDLDYLTETQRQTIGRFFGEFSLEKSSELKKRFQLLWDKMYDIYTALHTRLLAGGMLYEGALFRHVVESMSDDELAERLTEGDKTIVFAGFNVLNKVEHRLMSALQKAGKARFYWDYDLYYTSQHPENEAGHFLRKNLSDFPCAIADANAFDNLSKLQDVTFISCMSDNASARYTNKWLKIHGKEGEGTKKSVVLANERLMQAVLHAVPEEMPELNVTMGFPLTDTPVYGLISALMRLQLEGYDKDRKRFRESFRRTLSYQPFYEYIEEDKANILSYCGASTEELLKYLIKYTQMAALHFAAIDEQDIYEQLYSESLFQSNRMLLALLTLVSSERMSLDVTPATLSRLLRQMMASVSIPFHSEPDKGLQMMGILETRQLDFDDLLLLSVEEGILPRSTHSNSLIPNIIREAFGLTTQQHLVAVYAYYFYRLIQRAKHLTCVYNESCGDGSQHEMSRFLRQLLAESEIPIRTMWLKCEPSAKASMPMTVRKDAQVMAKLKQRYVVDKGKHSITLSPSAINTYMTCHLRFYLEQVLSIREPESLNEEISPIIVGNIFHDTAEVFYRWLQDAYKTNVIEADMLVRNGEIRPDVRNKLTEILKAAFDVSWFNPTDDPYNRDKEIMSRLESGISDNVYKGNTLIVSEVITKYLLRLLLADAHHAPFCIIGNEEERTKHFLVENHEGDNMLVRIGGRIDRLDEKDGTIRVVDYKTGSHVSEDVTMDKVLAEGRNHVGYYFQTFIYALCEMQDKYPESKDKLVKPVLFYPCKANKPEEYDPSLALSGETIEDFRKYATEFREGLQKVLNDIFDPAKDFDASCEDQSTCDRCHLRLLCNK